MMTAVSNEKHPVGQKKPRRRLPGWEAVRRRLPGRGAIRIFAALIAGGALLFVFRGYYLESLRDRPLTILGAATVVAAVVVLIRVGPSIYAAEVLSSVRTLINSALNIDDFHAADLDFLGRHVAPFVWHW